jgi:site-specific DNA-methyltransferase (adenine-specific)
MEFMRTLPDKAFELAVCDPPYGRGEDGGTVRSKFVKQNNGTVIHCSDGGYKKKEWDKKPPGIEYFNELQRISKHQIIWGINYMPVLAAGGRIVWDKINDGADQSGAEIASCSLNERVDIVRYMWRGMMQGIAINSNVQQGNKSLNEKRIHPTQKPVKLYEWLLTNYAKPGQKIFDSHLGSGSSAIAANNLGFELVGCELDEDYYNAACKRIAQHSQQQNLFDDQELCPSRSFENETMDL